MPEMDSYGICQRNHSDSCRVVSSDARLKEKSVYEDPSNETAEAHDIGTLESLIWHLSVLATCISDLQDEIDQTNRYLHLLLFSIGSLAGIALAACGAFILVNIW